MAACAGDPLQVLVTVPVAASIHSRVTTAGAWTAGSATGGPRAGLAVAWGTAIAAPITAAASAGMARVAIARRRMTYLSLRGVPAHRYSGPDGRSEPTAAASPGRGG